MAGGGGLAPQCLPSPQQPAQTSRPSRGPVVAPQECRRPHLAGAGGAGGAAVSTPYAKTVAEPVWTPGRHLFPPPAALTSLLSCPGLELWRAGQIRFLLLPALSRPTSGLASSPHSAGPLPGEGLEPSGRSELSGEAPRLGLRLRTPSKRPRLGRALATWVIRPFVTRVYVPRFFVRHNKDLDTCVAHSFSKSVQQLSDSLQGRLGLVQGA